ncbi:uncharacterized protein L201_007109 [Kwoniella dendrophila CBS 6074]|uniref:RING-type domain-containing protein n=1 Tax=Kwoniella dendrophila CBS 6074 TaxID=1295534 RepID=A0AAX4K3F1_9TREE
MNTGRTGAPAAERRKDDPLGSRGNTPTGGVRSKPRKKAKTTTASKLTPTPSSRSGPIPTPYLALAPTPISSLSASTIDSLAATAQAQATASASSSSGLVLPSSYVRSSQQQKQLPPPNQRRNKSTSNLQQTVNNNSSERNENDFAGGGIGPSTLNPNYSTPNLNLSRPISGQGTNRQPQQQKYVSSLLSPPTIIPGGTSATPRIQGSTSNIQSQQPIHVRRRSGERDRERGVNVINSRRSQERLREISGVIGNPSLTSLGQLGQILESGHLPENDNENTTQEDENGLLQAQNEAAQTPRRRRRIVRGENGTSGPVRRLTVSSREEGRALGLARGASMRRTNVWDDIPDAGEPPPPFPFPTASTSRLPPAFGTPITPIASSASSSSNLEEISEERPRSPPITYEQAIGLSPLPSPSLLTIDSAPSSTPSTPRPIHNRPTLSVSTTTPTNIPQIISTASPEQSPASTHYASAPSSPTQTVIGFEDFRANERAKRQERDDRRAWNEDLLAGYTLEERVKREMERRIGRIQSDEMVDDHQREVDETESEGNRAGNLSPVDSDNSSTTRKDNSSQASHEVPAIVATESSNVVSENLPNLPPKDAVDTSDTASPSEEVDISDKSAESQIMVPPTIDEDQQELSEGRRSVTLTLLDPVPSSGGLEQTNPELERDIPSNSQLDEDAFTTIAKPLSTPKDLEVQPNESTVSNEAPSAIEAAQPIQPNTEKPVEPAATPKRRQPTRSSTVETETAFKALLTPSVKRLSVPEFSPFRPQLAKSVSNEPLFTKSGWGISSSDPESSALLDDDTNNEPVIKEYPAEPMKEVKSEVKVSDKDQNLPPGREAALKRRNLEIKAQRITSTQSSPPTLPINKPKVKILERRPVSGPLINFDTPTPSPPDSTVSTAPRERPTSGDISALAASSAELLSLLELQDDYHSRQDNEPIAESSAQGAARMAKKPPPPPPPAIRRLQSHTPRLDLRRIPPPLPKDNTDAGHPISPSKLANENDRQLVVKGSTPKNEMIKPPLPARRAAPPPPPPNLPRLNLIPKLPPPLPARPSPARKRSSSSSSPTTPSISSKSTIKVSPSPQPSISPRLSLSLNHQSTIKPKGPRPPPPPPRARQTNWFSNFSRNSKDNNNNVPPADGHRQVPDRTRVAEEALSPVRPNHERSQSDYPRLVSPAQEEEQTEERERVIERSSSAANLGEDDDDISESHIEEQAVLPLADVGQSSSGNARITGDDENVGEERGERREWTDLDLLIHRIDRSNPQAERQEGDSDNSNSNNNNTLPALDSYEGYRQIENFFGPSKSQAATPAQLDTLLVGLIQIDSKRITTKGKVKLKLSLLGLRVIKCSICLSQFKQNEKAIMLPNCSHVGHESCAIRWFKEKNNCWVCREVLSEE